MRKKTQEVCLENGNDIFVATKKSNKVAKSKFLKTFGAGGLAVLMCAGVLCGTIIPACATAASNATNLAGGAQSADGALSPQGQLLNGTLDLDPANDPVIYTTDYGLEIRWHMAGLPTDPNDICPVPAGEKFENYAYFNHGGVNWVIIGYSNKVTTISLSGVVNLAEITSLYYNYVQCNSNSIWEFLAIGQTTPAGTAIWNEYDIGKDVIYSISSGTISQKAVFPNAKPSDELEVNQVLCFAQRILSQKSTFNDTTSAGNCYYNSRLMTTMNSYYNSNLTDLPIVEQTLKTIWAGASDTTNGSNLPDTYKIFPLALENTNEDFYMFDYIESGAEYMKESVAWWSRSGRVDYSHCARYINTSGVSEGWDADVYFSRGVRPAFVLEI